MKQRTDLSMDPTSDVVVFELSTGHIVRICDWPDPDEVGISHVEIWEHEAEIDENPQVYVKVFEEKLPLIECSRA